MEDKAHDSTFPPYTFEGALNLGVLDTPAIFDPSNRSEERFPCLANQIRLNPSTKYNCWFYRFSVGDVRSRLWFHMAENPSTTLYLDLYDSSRHRIGPPYRGNADELIDRVFDRGAYFIKVNTVPGTPNIGGFHIASIRMRGRPEAIELRGSAPAPLIRLGSVSKSNPAFAEGALWSFEERIDPQFNDRLPIFTHCIVPSRLHMHAYQEYEVHVTSAGYVSVSLERMNMRKWPLDMLNVCWMTPNGRYQIIEGGKIKVSAGPLRLAVGSYPGNITVVRPDAFTNYYLTVSK